MSYVNSKTLLAMAVAAALTGCQSPSVRDTNQKIAAAEVSAKQLLVENTKPKLQLVTERDGIFVAGDRFYAKDEHVLPAAFDDSFMINTRSKPVVAVADLLSSQLGYRVRVSSDAQRYLFAGTEAGATANPVSSQQTDQNAAQSTLQQSRITSGAGYLDESVLVDLKYEGSVRGFLDYMVAKTGLSWRFDGSEVVVFRHDTQTFTFNALDGTSSVDSSLTNDSANGSSTSDANTGSAMRSSAQQTRVNVELSIWENMKDSLASMLSYDGQLVMSGATGTITVTDTPDQLAKIGRYIERMNDVVSAKVQVRAEVYEVSLSQTDDYGIDWQAVYTNAASLGVTLATTPGGPAAAGANLTAAIINPNSHFKDTQLMVRAMSTQGDVSLKTTANLVTVNGQPTPLQVVDETSYLAETQVTTDAENVSVQLTPGKVTTGFTMNVLPRITDDGEVMLQYSMDMRSLERIDRIDVGDSAIEVPRVSTQNFLQRVALRPGSTLMLAGFERTEDGVDASGPDARRFGFVGGTQGSRQNRKMTVIMLTPYLLD